MAQVQRLKGDNMSFAAVAETLFHKVLNEGGTSIRIDVVFDDYRDGSIKNAEREKRGGGSGAEYRNIQANHKVKQWRSFLTSSKNKQAFIVFVSDVYMFPGMHPPYMHLPCQWPEVYGHVDDEEDEEMLDNETMTSDTDDDD
ncbi:hypothetical protein Bbelb_257340 [Branchiostoma belcheri]|nr:hypothetical protein Bbelb_257340 [Branchiostoma belcheri]